jgi:CRISPR/Cas system-associated endonuclease Cas1
VKAILSYAYAVLQSHVRIATVSQGLDPYIGYLHAIRLRRLALVYDLMEPPCPRVDHLVLERVMNSAGKPHRNANISVSSVLRRSPVFRISKLFLSKFITRSRLRAFAYVFLKAFHARYKRCPSAILPTRSAYIKTGCK